MEEIGILGGSGKALSKADGGFLAACLNTDREPIGTTETYDVTSLVAILRMPLVIALPVRDNTPIARPAPDMKTLSLSLLASLLSTAFTPAQAIKKFQFEVETIGGRQLTQDDFKNNVLIIDFWGTWCGPCKKAVPSLVNLYRKYKHHERKVESCPQATPDDSAPRRNSLRLARAWRPWRCVMLGSVPGSGLVKIQKNASDSRPGRQLNSIQALGRLG